MDTTDPFVTAPELRAVELRRRSAQLLKQARQLRLRSEQLIGRRERVAPRVWPRSGVPAASSPPGTR